MMDSIDNTNKLNAKEKNEENAEKKKILRCKKKVAVNVEFVKKHMT